MRSLLRRTRLDHAEPCPLASHPRSEYGEGTPPPPTLKTTDADKVRRALVADLRKGLVFDKKFKKGANKMLSARYANCSAERESPSLTISQTQSPRPSR